jgi:3-oxoacyl-[acyl-carrier protein] reductase
MEVNGSVALITGGGRGIGRVCARELARMGTKVSVCDLDQESINEVVEEIKNAGGDAIGILGNVAKEEDQQKFFKETIDAFGKINILIASAGIIRDGTVVTTDNETGAVVKKMSLEQWQSVVDVNLTGTFISVRDAVEAMVNGGWNGIIFVISSINKIGQIGQLNYSSTKIADALMPKILVGEFMLRNIRNIRVVGIAPGYVGTPILRDMDQKVLTAILKDVHLGRLIEPEEVARLIIHCIENDAINATTIEITGGVCFSKSIAK